MINDVENKYWTSKQAMKYLGIRSPRALQEFEKLGLPVIKINRKMLRFTKDDIDTFMKAHRVVRGKDD